MADLNCIGKIVCPRGKTGRMSCGYYQECLDVIVVRLLNKYGFRTAMLKVKDMLKTGDEHEYGISDSLLFSRFYNICLKEDIRVSKEEFDIALKESTISKGEKKTIRSIFEEILD